VTRGVADARSDVYAFGIMFYEMLTGKLPFTGEQPMQIAYQHANSEVPVPSELSADSTPAIDGFVRWLTQRDPEHRPANAGEALEVFDDIRADPYATPPGLPLPAHTETRVLPRTTSAAPTTVQDDVSAATAPTPSTSVLDPLQRAAVAGSAAAAGSTVARGSASAVDRVRDRSA